MPDDVTLAKEAAENKARLGGCKFPHSFVDDRAAPVAHCTKCAGTLDRESAQHYRNALAGLNGEIPWGKTKPADAGK
jgi:hypothetical protein